MTPRPIAILTGLGFALCGCTGKSGAVDDSVDPTTSSGTSNAETSDVTGGDDRGSSDGESSSGDGSNFIEDPDLASDEIPCDIWAQDCPAGEKCNPWATEGDDLCNAVKCTPLAPNPGQPGDPCTLEGQGLCTGIDDCDVSSMCWDGTCVARCLGNAENAICEDPSARCVIANDGVLILCLPTCNPLLQDCPDGEACYPFADAFNCAMLYESGAYGDSCEFINWCNPGLFCAPAGGVPGCASKFSCCSSYCDLSDPDASAGCEGVAGGQECVPWYEQDQAPPGFEDVGGCFIPA